MCVCACALACVCVLADGCETLISYTSHGWNSECARPFVCVRASVRASVRVCERVCMPIVAVNHLSGVVLDAKLVVCHSGFHIVLVGLWRQKKKEVIFTH